jgi:tetratricopeptide (TPR) repeat protein
MKETNPKYDINEIEKLYLSDNFDKVLELCTEIINNNSFNEEFNEEFNKEFRYTVYFLRAKVLASLNNLENALSDYNKAIGIKGNALAYVYRWSTKERLGRSDEDLEIGMTLAHAAIDKGTPTIEDYLALGLAHAAIDKGTPTIEDYLALGLAHARCDEDDVAVPYWEKAIQLNKLNAREFMPYAELARHYFKTNRFNDVIIVCKKAIELGISKVSLPKYIGAAYEKLGFRDEAINTYSALIGSNPNDSQIYKGLGRCYILQKRYDYAINIYLKAIDISPTDPENYKKLGSCYIVSKRYDDAINIYLKAIDISPKDPEALNGLAACYSVTGRPDKAIRIYSSLLDSNPNDSEIYKKLGCCYRLSGDYIRAIENYRIALELGVSNIAAVYSDLGDSYAVVDNNEEAINSYLNAIALVDLEHLKDYREHLENYRKLGRCYTVSKRYDDAINIYLKLIEFKHPLPEDYRTLGRCYTVSKRYDDAINIYLKAIGLLGASHAAADIYFDLGDSYANANRYEEAINSYHTAIELGTSYAAKIYKKLGHCYFSSKLYYEAIDSYYEAIKLDPSDSKDLADFGTYKELIKTIELGPSDTAKIYKKLGRCYLLCQRYDEAINSCCEAIESNPEDPKAHANLGRCYEVVGRYYDAIDSYNNAIKFGPSDIASLYYKIGQIYANLGLYSQAIENYNSAINLNHKIAKFYFERARCYHFTAPNEKKAIIIEDAANAIFLAPPEESLSPRENEVLKTFAMIILENNTSKELPFGKNTTGTDLEIKKKCVNTLLNLLLYNSTLEDMQRSIMSILLKALKIKSTTGSTLILNALLKRTRPRQEMWEFYGSKDIKILYKNEDSIFPGNKFTLFTFEDKDKNKNSDSTTRAKTQNVGENIGICFLGN